MRAIVTTDGRILKFTISQEHGVDIGNVPRDVGLERLRFIKNELIDLNDLSQFYVDSDSRLFAEPKFGRQLVKMKYGDRKKLKRDSDGQWTVKHT